MLYVAAFLIAVGVALFVAAPLTGAGARAREGELQRRLAQLEHERTLAMQGLRELEFDRQMNKLTEADSRELRARLEARALSAMSASERLRNEARQTVHSAPHPPRTGWPAAGAAVRGRFCPSCGTRAVPGGRFCGECGGALELKERA